MPIRSPSAAALLVAVWSLLHPGTSRPEPPDLHGTYRLQGRARIDARPFPAREDELRADAVLAPGAAGEVRVRLASQGFACELLARLGAAGALTFAPGQRCAVDLASEETEGRVEARLLAGSGRVGEDVLHLDLAFALAGSVRLRDGGSLGSLGQALSLPGAGGEPVPVRGEARGHAEGRRDRSRAAQ